MRLLASLKALHWFFIYETDSLSWALKPWISQETREHSLTPESGWVPGLWPVSHGGAHCLPLPPLFVLSFCTRKAQVDWLSRKPFHLSSQGGWEGDKDSVMYCRAAEWMHRIFHPNKCTPTCEHFFRLTTEPPLGFQPSPLNSVFKCTVPRLAVLVLSTAVMKLSEVKRQANVLQFSLQIWFWFHLNGSIPNCLPIAKT